MTDHRPFGSAHTDDVAEIHAVELLHDAAADGPFAAGAWDLATDGSYDDGTGATAQQTFASAGTYTVRLLVTDDDGDTASSSATIVVSGAAGSWANLQHKGLFASASATSIRT